jgi:hypothetical protein
MNHNYTTTDLSNVSFQTHDTALASNVDCGEDLQEDFIRHTAAEAAVQVRSHSRGKLCHLRRFIPLSPTEFCTAFNTLMRYLPVQETRGGS